MNAKEHKDVHFNAWIPAKKEPWVDQERIDHKYVPTEDFLDDELFATYTTPDGEHTVTVIAPRGTKGIAINFYKNYMGDDDV